MNDEQLSDRQANLGHWRRVFDRMAGESGTDFSANGYFSRGTFDITRNTILSLIGDHDGLEILDVGCGNGLAMKPLVKRNDVYGMDVSENMCALARAAGYKEAVAGDCEALEFDDGRFDAVVCSGVVQLLPSADRVLAEMTRVARSGGLVLVATANSESLLRLIFKKTYRRAYAFKELAQQASANGLEQVSAIPLLFPVSRGRRSSNPSFLTRLLMANFVISGIKPAVVSD